MKTTLISYTQVAPGWYEKLENIASKPSSLLDIVAFTARVSNPSNQMNIETSEKLVRYLIKNSHWSPLEMVSACIEIETTRDIAHQILRHRSFSFQEFSQRYADPTKAFEFEYRETRLQDTKNRQNSIEGADSETQYAWHVMQENVLREVQKAYKWAIENNIAKEQARVVLPEGMTPTRIYMSGTLRSWVHYIDLRSTHGTQKEHRAVVLGCGDVLIPIFPMIEEFMHGNV